MITETKQTAVWLWDVVRNPDVVWMDPETNEEASRERWRRIDRFHTFRPSWMYYFLTTGPGCGCRKRLGLWYTMWCMEHAFEIKPKQLPAAPRHRRPR